MKIKPIISLLVICLVFFPELAQAQNEESRCKPIKFLNVTPDAFECMKERLQEYGIYVPPGNEGIISEQGVTAEFDWDGKSNLTIVFTEKPFFVNCDTAERELTKFVEDAMACGKESGLSRLQENSTDIRTTNLLNIYKIFSISLTLPYF